MKVKSIKLKNYQEFLNTIENTQEQERQIKMKESADYLAYIKIHDKEAYKKYLSYATYLELCV
ncbi:hypothetical protein JHD48_07340 [Sulfurimonas sp. SAG-AH-194-I05]|nr:hypothetical protein [Sulfurimonas sp. SAG-AH-194-I05]MDF1875544.1 hypothetical protein [Sulfurimonas sp. SAG-AH-194-I05]